MIQEDQNEQEVQQEKFLKNIEEFIELMIKTRENNNELNAYDENQKIVFLIGITRTGKSTLFHLLQGQELILNENRKYDIKEQLPSQIGHGRMAKTKFLKSFQKNNIIIFDTPGLHDTSDGYQEIISQLNFQKTLNQFKIVNIYFLIVASYNTNNNNELQDVLRIVQQLFQNKDHFVQQKDKMKLVITRSKLEKDEMVGEMELIFQEIIQNNPKYRGKEILEHFLQNSSKILFFKKNANSNEQAQLRQEIKQFIQQIENKQPEQNNQVQNYQLIISDKGKFKIKEFLSDLIDFYKEKLTSVFNKINQQLNESLEIKTNLIFCQLVYNLTKKELYLNNVSQFQSKLYQILQHYNFDKCIDEALNQAKILFTEGYVNQMLQIQERNINFEINIDQVFENFKNSACQYALKFREEKINESKQWIQSFNQMFEVYKKLVELEDWKKLVVIIGNRLSGKSKSLNLLYKQQQFIENYLEKQKGIIKNQTYQDFVSLQQINQDVVIEIKQLQVELLPFLEIFFKTAVDRRSLFVIGLVIDGTEKAEDKIFQALNHFLESNQFDNLKIINNCQIQNLINQDRLIQLIPNLKQQNFDLQNTCCQIVENAENYQILNFEIFNDEKLKIIQHYNKKYQMIGCDWLFHFLETTLTEFQEIIFQNNFHLEDHSNLQNINILIHLSELDPCDSEDKFKIKLEKIFQTLQIEQPNIIQGKNFQTLQNLFKFLLKNTNLEQDLKSTINELKEIILSLEKLMSKFKRFLGSIYYIIPMAEIIDVTFYKFPTLLKDKGLYYIFRLVNDIYLFDQNLSPKTENQLQTEGNLGKNLIKTLIYEVKCIYKYLNKLKDLIIESQDADFVLNYEWFFTRWPKKCQREIKKFFQFKKKYAKVHDFHL